MKKAYSLLLALFASLPVLTTAVSAQGINPSGLVLDKWVEKTAQQGKYNLFLEAYVTGSSSQTITKIHIPSDLILVLDLSGSMTGDMKSDTFTPRNVTNYTYDIYGNNQYYYKDGDDYYLVSRTTWEEGGKTYYAMTYEKDGTTYYLNYTYGPRTTPTTFTGTSNILYKGVLYANKIQKIAALKNAVNNFIDVVAEDAQTNGVDNMISIVKYANGYYDSESSIAEGNHRSGGTSGSNYTEVVKNLISAKDAKNVSDLKTAVNSLAAYGATFAEYGIKKATYVLSGDNPNHIKSTGKKPRNKVVVMFTDGEPTHNTDFTESVANAAVSNAKELKDAGVTVYTIGVFSEDKDNVDDYMNRVSSNYLDATTYQNGTRRTDGRNFYMKASKPDELKEIFQDIAEASVSGSASVEIGSSATTVIDILSTDFRIPARFSINDIMVQKIAATGGAGTPSSPFTFDEANPQTLASHIVIGTDERGNDKISVSNFDFSMDDVWTEDQTDIISFGNWVGPRQYGNPKRTVVKGNKLRIIFPIELKPGYSGGYDDLTNLSESGIYSDELDYPIARFPIPHLDYPSIAIVKSGLKKGESALFSVLQTGSLKKDSNGDVIYDSKGYPKIEPITGSSPTIVTLTGVDDNGSEVHAILKDIPEGLYRITEQSWSWAYDVTSPSSVPYVEKILCHQTADDDFSGTEFGGILYDGIKCVTFKFGNTSKSEVPDHAEAVVTNDFKTGTATTVTSKKQPVISK